MLCFLAEQPCLLLHYPALTLILTVLWDFPDLYKFSVYTMFQWQAETLHISNPPGLTQSVFSHRRGALGEAGCGSVAYCLNLLTTLPGWASSLTHYQPHPGHFTFSVLILCRCWGLCSLGGLCLAFGRSTTSDSGSFLQIQVIPSLMM